MLCIFDGKPSTGDAGTIQLEILSLIGACEDDRTYSENTDGPVIITYDAEGNPISRSPAPTAPRKFSTSLPGLNINDFPDDMDLGNGVSLGCNVALDSGSRILSWCIFPNSLIGDVNSNFAALQSLMES